MSEENWISSSAAVQRIHRDGLDDLYVGSLGSGSQAFYSLNELATWFLDNGLDIEDPAWDYIEHLDELSANATQSDES